MMNTYLRTFGDFIIETDDENPVVIAHISDRVIDVKGGYRVRMKPVDGCCNPGEVTPRTLPTEPLPEDWLHGVRGISLQPREC